METECDYIIPKRSYIYQTSKEVKRVKDSVVEREKIDSSSIERSTGNGKWQYSGEADNGTSDCLLDILFPIEDRILCSRIHSTKSAEEVSELKPFNLVTERDGNLHIDREKVNPVWRTFSAKSGLCHFDVDVNTSRLSIETRLDPHSDIQDASMKLESHHNSSLARKKITDSMNTGVSDIRQNMTQQPLLPNFIRTEQNVEGNKTSFIEKAKEDVASSPVHLNGILKQENRGDGILFEFFTKDQTDVLCAKTSRPENASHWVYTFHSNKKKNYSGVWSIKDKLKKASILVGQMCASCQLFAEATSDGYLNNFMQLDFVLYDVDQAQIKVSSDENSLQCTKFSSNHQGLRKAVNSVYPENCIHISPSLPYNSSLYVTNPREQNDLSPSLEIAAIVMQVPLEIDYIEWEKGDLFLSDNSPQCAPVYVDKMVKRKPRHSININVIAPSGHHGMPHIEGAPSPLIERWKSGGQCDCGGWDTGCPIIVLENHAKKAENYSNGCFSQSIKLHVQGSKDRMPALTVTSQAEEGAYLVEFHARFSAVQAFAISVAVLHCLERNISMLRSNILKSLLKNELSHLLDITAEDVIQAQEEMRFRKPVPGKYILDPPFSPIRRA